MSRVNVLVRNVSTLKKFFDKWSEDPEMVKQIIADAGQSMQEALDEEADAEKNLENMVFDDEISLFKEIKDSGLSFSEFMEIPENQELYVKTSNDSGLENQVKKNLILNEESNFQQNVVDPEDIEHVQDNGGGALEVMKVIANKESVTEFMDEDFGKGEEEQTNDLLTVNDSGTFDYVRPTYTGRLFEFGRIDQRKDKEFCLVRSQFKNPEGFGNLTEYVSFLGTTAFHFFKANWVILKDYKVYKNPFGGPKYSAPELSPINFTKVLEDSENISSPNYVSLETLITSLQPAPIQTRQNVRHLSVLVDHRDGHYSRAMNAEAYKFWTDPVPWLVYLDSHVFRMNIVWPDDQDFRYRIRGNRIYRNVGYGSLILSYDVVRNAIIKVSNESIGATFNQYVTLDPLLLKTIRQTTKTSFTTSGILDSVINDLKSSKSSKGLEQLIKVMNVRDIVKAVPKIEKGSRNFIKAFGFMIMGRIFTRDLFDFKMLVTCWDRVCEMFYYRQTKVKVATFRDVISAYPDMNSLFQRMILNSFPPARMSGTYIDSRFNIFRPIGSRIYSYFSTEFRTFNLTGKIDDVVSDIIDVLEQMELAGSSRHENREIGRLANFVGLSSQNFLNFNHAIYSLREISQFYSTSVLSLNRQEVGFDDNRRMRVDIDPATIFTSLVGIGAKDEIIEIDLTEHLKRYNIYNQLISFYLSLYSELRYHFDVPRYKMSNGKLAKIVAESLPDIPDVTELIKTYNKDGDVRDQEIINFFRTSSPDPYIRNLISTSVDYVLNNTARFGFQTQLITGNFATRVDDFIRTVRPPSRRKMRNARIVTPADMFLRGHQNSALAWLNEANRGEVVIYDIPVGYLENLTERIPSTSLPRFNTPIKTKKAAKSLKRIKVTESFSDISQTIVDSRLEVVEEFAISVPMNDRLNDFSSGFIGNLTTEVYPFVLEEFRIVEYDVVTDLDPFEY